MDTARLRRIADDLQGSNWVKATFEASEALRAAAREIDSLRAQLTADRSNMERFTPKVEPIQQTTGQYWGPRPSYP